MSTTKGRTATKTRPIDARPEVTFRCIACGEVVTTAFIGGAYVRISDDVKKDQHGSENQRPLVLEKAHACGWHVPEWALYVDPDNSATRKNAVRPEYERMLADMEAGRVHGITATFADRIYRRMEDLQRLIDVVEANAVAIETVYSGLIDLTTASGRMVARVLGAVAAHEGEVKTERMRLNNTADRKAGKMPSGRRMFGFNSDGTHHPTEAAVVREVAERLLAGDTVHNICRDLEQRGVRTTLGNAWQDTALRRLLRNPRLAGHSSHHGEIVGRGQWQPILDQDTWETVVALVAGKSTARRPRVALLARLVVCGRCGAWLKTGYRYAKAHPEQRARIYYCPKEPGLGGCGRLTVAAEPVEAIVEDVAHQWLNDRRTRARLAKARKQQTVGGLPGEVASLRERLRDLDEALADPDAGDVSALVKASKAVRARLTDAEAKLAASVAAQQPLPDLDAEWPAPTQANLAERRRLVEVAVQRVVVNPGKSGRGFKPERVTVEPVPTT